MHPDTLADCESAYRASITDPAAYWLESLRYLFLAGERLDPDTYSWVGTQLGIPVIDNWWKTETGWPIAANPAGFQLLPIKPGSATRPMPGWHVQVVGPEWKSGGAEHRGHHKYSAATSAGGNGHLVE